MLIEVGSGNWEALQSQIYLKNFQKDHRLVYTIVKKRLKNTPPLSNFAHIQPSFPSPLTILKRTLKNLGTTKRYCVLRGEKEDPN